MQHPPTGANLQELHMEALIATMVAIPAYHLARTMVRVLRQAGVQL